MILAPFVHDFSNFLKIDLSHHKSGSTEGNRDGYFCYFFNLLLIFLHKITACMSFWSLVLENWAGPWRNSKVAA